MMNLEHFPYSESAKRMMSYLTQNFYDNSYVGKWIFEVIGQEWDMVKEIFDSFPEQGFPQTCSWSLKYFEQKFGLEGKGTFEERKQALLQKITIFAPFTPAKIKQCIEALTGINMDRIQVLEYPKEFRFEIRVGLIENDNADLINAKKYISVIKPAHLIMLLILEIILLCEIRIKSESQLRIKTEFYPRHHMEYLFFDGSWILDGTWKLNGYKLLDSIDLYPVYLKITSKIVKEIKNEDMIHLKNSVQLEEEVNLDARVMTEVILEQKNENNIVIKDKAAVKINTALSLKIEKNLWFLDGANSLDGSLLLNAEMQEVIL